ncbi:hypothetical protein, partial [Kingella kingae]|uniref:hypothetical protein n=1 Tax=Kingella kingae TaxID=504 RepID=UPI001C13288D
VNAIVVFVGAMTSGAVAAYITTRTLNRRYKYLFLGKVFPLFPYIESHFFQFIWKKHGMNVDNMVIFVFF